MKQYKHIQSSYKLFKRQWVVPFNLLIYDDASMIKIFMKKFFATLLHGISKYLTLDKACLLGIFTQLKGGLGVHAALPNF